jgi:hypothetical protein
MALVVLAVIGCGGGGAPIEIKVRFGAAFTTSMSSIVLDGETFIPAGSACPASNEFIIVGTFGTSAIGVQNAATGATTPGFLQAPWVCNDGSKSVAWASNPVALVPGPNLLTVTMSDGQRSSSATITVTRTGP